MGDFNFATEVTVRFAETDAQGIAHHAAYLVWFETTRIECDLRGARFRFEYSVERAGQRIAEGWTTHACVSMGDHRPTRVPPWLAEAIAEAESL